MLHINVVRKVLAEQKPFSCRVWKKNGEISVYNNVVATSTYFENNTVNLKFIDSGQIRKLPILFMFELNDEEIFI